MERLFSIKFLFHVFLVMLQLEAYQACIETERMGLLDIKASLLKSNCEIQDTLESWVDDADSNCCHWDRVKCNNSTLKRVVSISLYQVLNVYYESLRCSLNLSLLYPFEELLSLNLSYNNFNGWSNHDDFKGLKKLQVLDAHWNYFDSSILSSIGTFTSLKTLILQGNSMHGYFPCNELRDLKNLEVLDISLNLFNGTLLMKGFKGWKKLQVLDVSGNSFNSSILSSIGALTSLKTLILSYNFMGGYFASNELRYLKNLEVLNISGNKFNGTLLTKGLCGFKSLLQLDLSANQFSGALPQCLGNLTNLQLLYLYDNEFTGNPQSVISKLTSLKELDLSFNDFEGLFSFSALANHTKLEIFDLSSGGTASELETETPSWFPTFQLKEIHLQNSNINVQTRKFPSFLFYQHDLESIDLSHNKLVGTFPNWILQNNSKLSSMDLSNNSLTGTFEPSDFSHILTHLDISINNITGQIPKDIGTVLSNLKYLDISRNCFYGIAPSSIGEMKQLYWLDLSNNNLSGKLPKALFSTCESLEELHLSDNNFQGSIFPKMVNVSQLNVLDMKNNNFSGNINVDTFYCPNLLVLDISNNMLEGTLPSQLCNLSTITYLDLSQNRLFRGMPSCFNASSLKFLFLQENELNGLIPRVLSRSSNLKVIDMRYNKFSGSIPSWIGQLSELLVLLLGGNALNSHIPEQLCQLRKLNLMDFSNNSLCGSIPSCFHKVSFGTTKENSDGFWGVYVVSMYNRDPLAPPNRRDVIVEFETKYRQNSYKGDIINSMGGIDLSNNNLSGEIPLDIGQLCGLRSLNLSFNHLSGSIPVSFSNLTKLESLDLRNNNLSGEIPPQLVKLNFLGVFDVSYNNLSGRILDKGQFGTFDESSYKGNPRLCGDLIHKRCNPEQEIPIAPPSINADEEGEGFIDMVWFYWSFCASYVTVLLGLATILHINRYWCMLWFRVVDDCIYWWSSRLYFWK